MTSSVIRSWWSSYWWAASSVAGAVSAWLRRDENRARMGSRARFRVSWKLLAIFIAMKFVTVPLGVLVYAAIVEPATAEVSEDPEEHATVVMREMTGQVSVATPRLLAVEYKRDDETSSDYEMAFALDADGVPVSGVKRTLSELRPGDVVSVTYEEKTWEDDAGAPRMRVRIQSVKFIRSAEQGLRSGS